MHGGPGRAPSLNVSVQAVPAAAKRGHLPSLGFRFLPWRMGKAGGRVPWRSLQCHEGCLWICPLTGGTAGYWGREWPEPSEHTGLSGPATSGCRADGLIACTVAVAATPLGNLF